MTMQGSMEKVARKQARMYASKVVVNQEGGMQEKLHGTKKESVQKQQQKLGKPV